MADDPWYIKLLENLGVNTTRLRWRLYQREQQAKRMVHEGGLPDSFKWMRYRHKICPHCRAVVDRDARTCDSCGNRVPSMTFYRIRRFFATLAPAGSPAVVNAFLGVMIFIFIVQFALDGFALQSLIAPSSAVLYVLGWWEPRSAIIDGEWWRYISFGLLHSGIFHIGFNGYALTIVGPVVEQQVTSKRMLVLITFTQLTSALATDFWYYRVQHAIVPTVGASGWLFGLIGFGIIMFHRMGDRGRPARDQLLRWAAIIFIIGLFLNFNNAAHAGGMVGGMLFGLLPEETYRTQQRTRALWDFLFWGCLAVWAITLFFMARSLWIYWPELQNMQ